MIRCHGHVAFVRENHRLPGRGFLIHSGQRLAHHRGERIIECATQVLELCAPRHAWERIARAAANADALGRHVLRNRRFTADWAHRQFERARTT